MNEFKVLKLSIQDYFTKPMLKILAYPLVGSIFVLYAVFFTVADFSIDTLETQTKVQQQDIKADENNTTIEEESYTGSTIVDFLIKRNFTSWLASFLIYSLGIFAVGYLSIFISLNIIGLLTPKILSIIQKQHYKDIKIKPQNGFMTGKFYIFKTVIIMILLFILLIPLYFIPGINLIAINLPFYYFFHKLLHHDIGTSLASSNDIEKIYSSNKWGMRLRTLLLYIVSLIPFMAFFISIFYVIYLGHIYFIKLENNKTF